MSRYLLLAIALLFPRYSTAADVWHWVKAANETDSWQVLEGDADVNIDGEHFAAQLFAKGTHKDAEITLKGAITASRITATEIVIGTDGPAATFKGRLRTQRWPGETEFRGVKTIVLTDGWSVIALTRGILH